MSCGKLKVSFYQAQTQVVARASGFARVLQGLFLLLLRLLRLLEPSRSRGELQGLLLLLLRRPRGPLAAVVELRDGNGGWH